MQILPNITKTLFYSLLFAIGGAPSIAMWITHLQVKNPEYFLSVFMSLTLFIACIIVPIILLQNAYLLYKRQSINVDNKVTGLAKFYFLLDIACLISWIYFKFT